jgi:hypothetical protein
MSDDNICNQGMTLEQAVAQMYPRKESWYQAVQRLDGGNKRWEEEER